MNCRNLLLASIFSILACSSAWANVVNYSTGFDFYPGIIPIGQSGTIEFSGTEISSQTNAQTGVNGIFGFADHFVINPSAAAKVPI